MNNIKLVKTKKDFEQLEEGSPSFMIDPSTGLVIRCELVYFSTIKKYYMVNVQKNCVVTAGEGVRLFGSKKVLSIYFGI